MLMLAFRVGRSEAFQAENCRSIESWRENVFGVVISAPIMIIAQQILLSTRHLSDDDSSGYMSPHLNAFSNDINLSDNPTFICTKHK